MNDISPGTAELDSKSVARAQLAEINRDLEQRVAERTAGLQYALEQRKAAEERLRARERRSRELLEALPAAVYTTDAAGRITFYNQAAADLWGCRPALGSDQWCGSWKLYWPDGTPLPHEQCPMAITLKENRPVRGMEAVAERPDGTRVTFVPYPTPLRDATGMLTGAVNMLVDITERKRAEIRIEMLAREVDHRAKNMLAVIQAMVRFTRADTVEDFAAAIHGRVTALARAHSVLSDSRWQGADLRQLVEEELAPYAREDGQRVRIDGTAVVLAPTAAQSMAMVIHELATNALKYGAFASPTGSVHVAWSRGVDGRLTLRWMEAGGPSVTRPSRRGFGLGVIERTLCDQLSGEANFEWQANGLVCELRIPDDHLAG